MLTIGAFAARGGVSVETVRFYQRRGLLRVPNSAGSVRRYGTDDVRKLNFIRQAQGAGFTLSEIRELIELDAQDDRVRARDLALARIEQLDRKVTELTRARQALRKLARECGGSNDGPCPILTAFET